MKRCLICLYLLLVLITLGACSKITYEIRELPSDFQWNHIILFEDDSYTFDVNALFKDYDIKISNYKIKLVSHYGKEVIKINKNKISALDNAIVTLFIELFDNENKIKYEGLLAKVVCVINSKLIEIKTAEDLIRMGRAKTGNYILKNDIDLSGIDFEPIGNFPAGDSFSGMFINLEGYIIKNLTITSSNNVYGGANGGLFGDIRVSFIYGLILEDVSINVSDFNGNGSAHAGGLAGRMSGCVVINNHVFGTIKGQNNVGGLSGYSDYSLLYNNSFEGNVLSQKYSNDPLECAGGLIGWSSRTYIEKGEFNGTITSTGFVGGIVGKNTGLPAYLKENTFIANYNNTIINNPIGENEDSYLSEWDNWNVKIIE